MSTTLIVLSYIGPGLGILGFIITPGITVIYPWLREKFNKDIKEETDKALSRPYNHINTRRVLMDTGNFFERYKWDWRPKIIKKKRELRALKKEKDDLIARAVKERIMRGD